MKTLRQAKRFDELEESPTLAVTAKAKALMRKGRDIIGFGAGEPDFDTPDNIKNAAIRALAEGRTRYTPVGGIPELKEAIVWKLDKDNGLSYAEDEVLVSCGAKHSLYNLFQVLLNPGDEVLVPAPYWVSYPPIIKLAHGVPMIVPTMRADGFKVGPDELSTLTTQRTRALIINSPSNPTGSLYTRVEIEALVNFALEKGLVIVSDDIYEKIIYDGAEFVSAASLSKEARGSTFIVNGVSKAYAMTGWRIGYVAGPREIIKAATLLQSHSTSNPASISQWGAVEAITGPQDSVARMVGEFAERRTIMVDGLNAIDGISADLPGGAFYVFADVSGLIGRSFKGKKGKAIKIKGSVDLAGFLLDEAGVAVVPGVAFGFDAYVRLSYACSTEDILGGVDRIAEAAERLG